MRTLIGDPDKDAAMFARYSPLPNAARLKQPLLMAHGAQDRRVPPVHARKFRAAVSEGNPHVEFLFYDNEGHGWAPRGGRHRLLAARRGLPRQEPEGGALTSRPQSKEPR